MTVLYLAYRYRHDERFYPDDCVGAFRTREKASAAAREHLGLGTVEPVTLFEDLSEFADHERSQVRERALGKLTDDERHALGLAK
jgi:hypothetical protein